MNPLMFSDPTFLVFYVVFALMVLALLMAARRALEAGALPKIELRDPYLFACLQGGPAEVVRVSTIDLMDRGLLTGTGDTVRVASGAPTFGLRPIERTILDHFRGGASLSSSARDTDLKLAAAAEYEPRLRSFGLLPNAEIDRLRRIVLGCAVMTLVGMAGAKIVIALGVGRTNVGLLIILTVVMIVLATLIWNPYRTRRGDDYLSSVQSLFTGLRRRASELRPGSGNRDLLWLTALFGVATLPMTAFPAAALLQPKSDRGGCGGGGGGCGSGGCGGGGCGGG